MIVGPVNSEWTVREQCVNSALCPLKLKHIEKKKKRKEKKRKKEAWNTRNIDRGEKRWTQTLTKSRNTLLFALILRGSHLYGLKTIHFKVQKQKIILWSVWILLITENWKHCNKIFFKCMNITVRPNFKTIFMKKKILVGLVNSIRDPLKNARRAKLQMLDAIQTYTQLLLWYAFLL